MQLHIMPLYICMLKILKELMSVVTCFGCNDKLFIIPERFCDAIPPTAKKAIKYI